VEGYLMPAVLDAPRRPRRRGATRPSGRSRPGRSRGCGGRRSACGRRWRARGRGCRWSAPSGAARPRRPGGLATRGLCRPS